MRKSFLFVIILIFMLEMNALAAPGRKTIIFDTTLEDNLPDYLDIPWEKENYSEGDGRTVISRNAVWDGHAYSIDIISTFEHVDMLCFTGWFEDIRQDDNHPNGGPDGLWIYKGCLHTCIDYLSDGEVIGDYIFSIYSIYDAVKSGSQYYFEYDESDFMSWKLLPTQPGRLVARNSEGGTVEAQLMDDGMMWFTVTF